MPIIENLRKPWEICEGFCCESRAIYQVVYNKYYPGNAYIITENYCEEHIQEIVEYLKEKKIDFTITTHRKTPQIIRGIRDFCMES